MGDRMKKLRQATFPIYLFIHFFLERNNKIEQPNPSFLKSKLNKKSPFSFGFGINLPGSTGFEWVFLQKLPPRKQSALAFSCYLGIFTRKVEVYSEGGDALFPFDLGD